MLIVEIATLDNGAHRNQTGNFLTIPEGWAVIPESIGTAGTLENFPFGEITLEENTSVPTVATWSPLPVPEPPPPPSVEENPDQPVDPEAGESQKTYAEKLDSLTKENTLLKAQIKAQTDRSDFIEDCIAEMAMLVYAE